MMDTFLLLFSSVVIYVCGYSIINFFPKLQKITFIEKLAYSYGLGLGLISLIMFLSSVFKIPFSRIQILFPILIICLISYKLKSFSKTFRFKKISLSGVHIFILLLILLTLLYVLFEALLRPVSAWDAWATWYFTGKAFYINKTLSSNVYLYGHFESPPVISLLVSYTYTILGKQNDTISLLNFFLFYLNIVLLLFSNLKKYTTLTYSLVFTFLFASMPIVVRHAGRYDIGNADLPLSYFFLGSVLLFDNFMKKKSTANLVLLEFFLGIGAMVKNEGITFLIIMQMLIICIFIFKKLFSNRLIFSYIIGFIPFIGWFVYKKFHHIPPIYFLSDYPHLERLPNIIFLILPEFINFQRWNILWPVFFVFLLYSIVKNELKNINLLLPVLFQLLVYIYIYVITSGDASYITQIHGTLDRLLLHLTPIIVLWMGIQSRFLFAGLLRRKLV